MYNSINQTSFNMFTSVLLEKEKRKEFVHCSSITFWAEISAMANSERIIEIFISEPINAYMLSLLSHYYV